MGSLFELSVMEPASNHNILRPSAPCVPKDGDRSVLIVQDDPDLQFRLARALTVHGCRVVGTGSGEGALALLSKWKVDVVLLDEQLVGLDGLEVAERIRQHHPLVPIALLVDGEGPNLSLRARRAGITAFAYRRALGTEISRMIDDLRDAV